MKTPVLFKIKCLKNQIAACLREIAKGVKKYVLDLCDLEQKLNKLEAIMKAKITGREFADKIAQTWNTIHGSEWHHLAACFVKANVWDKKEDEIRVYFLKGYISLKEKADKSQGLSLKFIGLQYDFQDKLTAIVKNLASLYETGGNLRGSNEVWLDEDGNEVDPILNPADAVVKTRK